MRVVVTGATGNVGALLLPALVSDPAVSSVLGLARRVAPSVSPGLELRACDVGVDDLVPHLRGADALVHLAWDVSSDPAVQERTNVLGSRRVLHAALRSEVPLVVAASSVLAYSPAPKVPHDESSPVGGVPTSTYSRHKAFLEAFLDEVEDRVRVVRFRPGLTLRSGAPGLAALFRGLLFPTGASGPRLPLVPWSYRLALSAVHTRDVVEAYRLALHAPVSGAFNLASDRPLDGRAVAAALGTRSVYVPEPLLRRSVLVADRLRAEPSGLGWLDAVLSSPLLDSRRARDVLGWVPSCAASDALADLLSEGGGSPSVLSRP